MKKLWWKIFGYKKFAVRYPDGAISIPMRWEQANAYQAIFGGRIVVKP